MSTLQPVRKQDLSIGTPLPYPIYDANNNLLLREGQIISNATQLETLARDGLFHNPLWQSTRTPAATSTRARIPVDIEESSNLSAPTDSKVLRDLNQVKLQPNIVLHVQSVGDPLKPKASVRLIGWLDKMGVMISALSPQGGILPFRENEVLQLKAISGKHIVVFTATILKVCFTPFPYLHLSWPDKIQLRQLRNSLRINTHLIVSVSGEALKTTPAKITNLSASGAMLESSTLELAPDQMIQLALRLPAAGEDHTMTLHARVCNRHVDPPSTLTQYGLAFEPMGTAERLVLEHFIFYALLES